MKNWELSSAGSEHLPYKQGVAGSNPAVPTKESLFKKVNSFFFVGSEHPDTKVGRHAGSNPAVPTKKSLFKKVNSFFLLGCFKFSQFSLCY